MFGRKVYRASLSSSSCWLKPKRLTLAGLARLRDKVAGKLYFLARQFCTLYKQTFSNLRPLLSIFSLQKACKARFSSSLNVQSCLAELGFVKFFKSESGSALAQKQTGFRAEHALGSKVSGIS